MAFAVIGILMVMIVPLPTVLLDTLLAMNISIAIIILLISMYLIKVLEFSIFPVRRKRPFLAPRVSAR